MLQAPQEPVDDGLVFPPNEVAEVILVLAIRHLSATSARRRRVRIQPDREKQKPPTAVTSNWWYKRIQQHDRPSRHDTHALACIYSALCVLPTAVTPLATRAALMRIWWYTMDTASRDGRLDLLALFVKLNRVYDYALDYSPAALDLAAGNGHLHLLKWWLNESRLPLGMSLHAIHLAMRGNHVDVLDWMYQTMKSHEHLPPSERALRMDPHDWYQRYKFQDLLDLQPSLDLQPWHTPGHVSFVSSWHVVMQEGVDAGSLQALRWWTKRFSPDFYELYQDHVSIQLARVSPAVMHWWLYECLLPIADYFESASPPVSVMLVQYWIDAIEASNWALAQYLMRLRMFPTFRDPDIQRPSPHAWPAWNSIRRVASTAISKGNSAAIALLCTWTHVSSLFPRGSQSTLVSVGADVDLVNWLASGVIPHWSSPDLISHAFIDQATAQNHVGYLKWVDERRQHGMVLTPEITPSQEALSSAVLAGHLDTLEYWLARPAGRAALHYLAECGPRIADPEPTETSTTVKSTSRSQPDSPPPPLPRPSPVSLAGLKWLAKATNSLVTITPSILHTASMHAQIDLLNWSLTQYLGLGITVPDTSIVECIECVITHGHNHVLDWWLAQCPLLFSQNAATLLRTAFKANRAACLEWWFAHPAALPVAPGLGTNTSSDGRKALQRSRLDVLDMLVGTGSDMMTTLARRARLASGSSPMAVLRWAGGVRAMEWVVRVAGRELDIAQGPRDKATESEAVAGAYLYAHRCLLMGCIEYLRTRMSATHSMREEEDMWFGFGLVGVHLHSDWKRRLDCPSYPCKCVELDAQV